MKRFALIGHPVAGSLSPRLFSAAYDGRFAYDLVDRELFADAWQVFLDSYEGINVTAPYKMDAFSSVDELSESALETGAVNLVVRRKADSRPGGGAQAVPRKSETPFAASSGGCAPDILVGYNTDVDGVVESVKECGIPVSDALVVGTGGAARAAVVAARRLGCRVTVSGRSLEKAAALVRSLVLTASAVVSPPPAASAAGIHSSPVSDRSLALTASAAVSPSPVSDRSLASAAALAAEAAAVNVVPLDQTAALSPDLIIYTLPGSAPVPPGLPTAGAVVLEAEYKAPALALVSPTLASHPALVSPNPACQGSNDPALSSARCKAYISGRRWLLHQAVAGYRLFTGLEPSIDAMSAAL